MITIDALTIEDYDDALKLWLETPELGISKEFDTRERVAAYLARNPGLSTAAREDGQLVGSALCGHDGRRGSLYHVAVAREHREQGVARRMIERCMERLRADGIHSGFLFVHSDNTEAAQFWQATGWRPAPPLLYYYREF